MRVRAQRIVLQPGTAHLSRAGIRAVLCICMERRSVSERYRASGLAAAFQKWKGAPQRRPQVPQAEEGILG